MIRYFVFATLLKMEPFPKLIGLTYNIIQYDYMYNTKLIFKNKHVIVELK